ncbi:PilW family protein [Roseateles chitinivorans]|uniref:PilW family protein n=1 Tax=Roseateles chitinivorans TaxID=2917965 RepID=UPI003D665329
MSFHSLPPRAARGFTLIELLISMTIGLVLIAALGTVVNRYEISKRRNSSTSDLALNSGYLTYDLDRQLRSAGSGFYRLSTSFGCLMHSSIAGSQILPALTAFPAPFGSVSKNVRMIPLMVWEGAGQGGSDLIQVMNTSAGVSETPMQVIPKSVKATTLQLDNFIGIRQNDLLLLAEPLPAPCMVVQAGAIPAASASPNPALPLGGTFFSSSINNVSIVTFGMSGEFTSLVNLGNQAGNTPRFQLLGVNAAQQLVSYDMLRLNNMPNDATAPVPLADGVMDLRVRYGIGSVVGGKITTNWVTPSGAFSGATLSDGSADSSANLSAIVAIRVSMLLRAERIENDVSSPSSFKMFSSLPANMQVTRNIAGDELKRTYKLVEFTVPVRNAITNLSDRPDIP